MRALGLVLLLLLAVPLAGCETVGALFSAALWVPGLFLVLEGPEGSGMVSSSIGDPVRACAVCRARARASRPHPR